MGVRRKQVKKVERKESLIAVPQGWARVYNEAGAGGIVEGRVERIDTLYLYHKMNLISGFEYLAGVWFQRLHEIMKRQATASPQELGGIPQGRQRKTGRQPVQTLDATRAFRDAESALGPVLGDVVKYVCLNNGWAWEWAQKSYGYGRRMAKKRGLRELKQGLRVLQEFC